MRALTRMGQGNLSSVKSVEEGVLEYRIDFGPGYRVYFGRDGDVLVIRDIETAVVLWRDYKRTR